MEGPHRTYPAAAKCPLQASISLRVCTPPATEGLNAWMAVWVDGWRKGTHRAQTTLIPLPSAIWDAVWHFKGESQGGVNPGAVESPPLRRAALHSSPGRGPQLLLSVIKVQSGSDGWALSGSQTAWQGTRKWKAVWHRISWHFMHSTCASLHRDMLSLHPFIRKSSFYYQKSWL